MKKPKVLVIGLDGATWKNLNPLIKEGKLPFFKKIIERGARGTLKSILPPLTAPAWVSFQTGVNPGKHGIFGFLNIRQNPANPSVVNANDIKEIRIWDYLGRLGLKSLVINMPVSHPVSEIPGILISSFLTPPGATFVYPKSFEKKLREIGYKVDLFEGKFSEKKKGEVLNQLLNLAEKRARVFKMLSKEDDFSFFFLLFKETDIAQHLFWGEDKLDEFYLKFDAILEDLYNYFEKKLDGQKNFLLVSDHGFHKIPEVEFSIYAWLKSRSYIKTKTVFMTNFWRLTSFLNAGLKALGFSLTRTRFAKKIRSSVVSEVEKKELKNILGNSGLLAAQEGVYFFENFGGERKRLVKDLTKVTYQGKRVFKEVYLAKEIYRGRCVNMGPDIVWLINEKFSVNFSPVAKEIFDTKETNLKGDHWSDPEGIFLADGKPFKRVSGANLNLIDIYSLVCYLLDVGVPDWLDGRLPKKVISDRPGTIRTEKQEIEDLVERSIRRI